jgi:hypothetical protein
MSKHTKGPWKTHLVDDTLVVDGNGLIIAHMGGLYLGDASPMEANAKLIAAAPDLLEALEALYAATEQHVTYDVKTVVYNAIAKAKGEA